MTDNLSINGKRNYTDGMRGYQGVKNKYRCSIRQKNCAWV
jgi:hypothetical protein